MPKCKDFLHFGIFVYTRLERCQLKTAQKNIK